MIKMQRFRQGVVLHAQYFLNACHACRSRGVPHIGFYRTNTAKLGVVRPFFKHGVERF